MLVGKVRHSFKHSESTTSGYSSGVGLDPEKQKQIFEAFYTTKPNGMGMGLSISRSIVRNQGGRLWAESNEGPGATFRFTVPKA